jgi:hypothetical protein
MLDRGPRMEVAVRRVRYVSIVVLLLGVMAGLVAPTAVASPAGFGVPVTGRPLLQWAPEDIGPSHKYTTDQAVRAARHYDVIVALPQSFSRYVNQMRQANPALVLLSYTKGTYSLPDQKDTYPPGWYSYDAAGDKIQNIQYHTWLMNPASAGWVQNRADVCASLIVTSGYDGCMLDKVGTAALDPGSDTALPINPATGQVWTASDWLAATTELAGHVRAAVMPSIVVGNGLATGPEYFSPTAPTSQLLAGLDGGFTEAFLRTPHQRAGRYPSVTAWTQSVEMLVDASTRDKPVLALTKLWSSATSGQVAGWHRYSLASFLLGTDGTSYYAFTGSKSDLPALKTPWTVNIGVPLAGYGPRDGVYQRAFSKGLVLVNPASESRTVPLADSYTDMAGTPVSGSLVMPAHSGQVLTRTG